MSISIGGDGILVSSSGPRAHLLHDVFPLDDLAYQPDRPSPPERPLGPRRPTGTDFWSVLRPPHRRPTFSPDGATTTTSSPPNKETIWNSMSANPPWTPLDNYRPTARPPGYYPDVWSGWKSPVIKPEPPSHVLGAAGASESNHTALEKLVWVVLGGIGVLLLIAIFIEVGKPIRRERRRAWRARPAPAPPSTGLHAEHADGDPELGALTRATDAAASSQPGELHDELPPPYSECVRTPPYSECVRTPRYSECVRPPRYSKEPPPPCAASASYTDIKHVEPQVHTHHPIGCELTNAGVKAE